MKNRSTWVRQSLAFAVALGLGSTALAQSTTGSIFGQVASGQGDSVLIKSSTGLSREVPLDDKGRYSVGQLPLGTYTVSLQRDGNPVETRDNISIKLGAGTEVSFVNAEAAKNLTGVSVTANALCGGSGFSRHRRGGLTRSDRFLRFLSRTSEAVMLPI